MSNIAMIKGPKAHAHSVWLYWGVFVVLILLTVVTVNLAQHDFGEFGIVITILIAGTKALLVVGFFMHLAFDNKFFGVVAGTSLVFLSLLVSFPVIDMDTRADLDSEQENFLPRDQEVYKYELNNPKALPLRPGLKEAKKSDLIFVGPSRH